MHMVDVESTAVQAHRPGAGYGIVPVRRIQGGQMAADRRIERAK